MVKLTREEKFDAMESARGLLEDAAQELKDVPEVAGVLDDIMQLMETIGAEMDEITLTNSANVLTELPPLSAIRQRPCAVTTTIRKRLPRKMSVP